MGPISKLSSKLGRVNLIYGKNENGKTYLVDLILQSLFKNRTSDRALDGSGSLEVTGLDGGPKKFKGSTKPKLEDLLLDSEDATSINLSRLCVVKAGELGFDPKNRNTLPEDTIKGYLSDQKVVEEILKSLGTKAILSCKITNGEVEIGKNQGKVIEKYQENLVLLANIDKWIAQIDQDTTALELLRLEEQLAEVSRSHQEQQIARRILAYQLQKEIDKLENELNSTPADLINKAESLIPQIKGKVDDVAVKKIELDKAREASSQLQWLENANERFARIKVEGTVSYPVLPIILFVLFLLGGIAASFFQQPWVAVALLAASTIPFYFSVRSATPNPAGSNAQMEQQSIIREFNERFNARSQSIVTLQVELKKQFKANERAGVFVEEIQKEKTVIESLRSDLHHILGQLFGTLPAQGSEENAIWDLKKKSRDLAQSKESIQYDLNELLVAKSDQLPGESNITYNAQLAKNLQEREKQIAGEIEKIRENFKSLYQGAAAICQTPFISSPSAIIESLREKREKTVADLKHSRALIFAWLSVGDAVEHQKNNEMQTILATLEASTCSSYLHKITKKYQTLSLVDGQIVLRNGAEIFSLDELSTGTQEQVLLAIRLGLLEHIMGDKRGFIILDDAFQHSDWERRNYLVDTLAEIIADGWQVLYFTMDDHIRDLFHKKLAPRFAAEFVEVDLTKAQS